MTTMLALTDDELLILDGRCTTATQAEVDAAKTRRAAAAAYPDLSALASAIVGDVLTEAKREGRLVWRPTRISRCALCGRDDGWVLYKSGPNRGRPNYKKRRTFPGIDLAYRFVRTEHRVTLGGCAECITAALPSLRDALLGVRVALPPQLRTDGQPVWTWYQCRRCTKCGWEGHEGEMRRRPTLMGDGTYPAGCPSCDAENLVFGESFVEMVAGFALVADGDDR